MNPVIQAIAASAVRWLMAVAGAHGVELGNDQAETIINAILIVVPLIWSAVHKVNVDAKIKEAKTGV